jgi:small subunit ribosomal protein S9
MVEDERRDEEQEPTEPGAGEQPESPEQVEEAPAEQAAAETAEQPESPEQVEEAPAEQAAAEEPEQPSREGEPEPAAPPEAPAEEAPQPEPAASAQRGRRDRKDEVIPGEHLEPDLVLEPEPAADQDQFAYPEAPEAEAGAPPEAVAPPEAAAAEEPAAAQAPAARTPIDLAADARYQATGKRKSSVARVIVKPGSGEYTINGKTLDEYFPRPTLQRAARQPLETAGYESRMDVVAKIHGGGVSAQAGALRHGVARALVEADPNLRTELKRRGFLTRDARAKERKKAGLKKARKRPQFSKR